MCIRDRLRGVDGAARYAAVGAAGAFAVAALAYGAVAVSGRMPSRLRKPFLRAVGLLGLLFVCALAAAHVLAGDPAWATAATPAQMLGCAFLGGSALAALLFENAGALEGRAAKGVLAAFAATGAVLGLGGLAAHVAVVLGAAGIAGVELVRAASTHVAVGAVSYTHLDVYKRQRSSSTSGTTRTSLTSGRTASTSWPNA